MMASRKEIIRHIWSSSLIALRVFRQPVKNKTKASDLTGIRLTVATRRDLAYLATTVPTALCIETEWFKFPLFNLTTAKDGLQC